MQRIVVIVFLLCVFFSGNVQAGELNGFVEGAYGATIGGSKADNDDYNLAEARVQLKYRYFPSLLDAYGGEVFLKGEALADAYKDTFTTELREGNLFFSPVEALDVKAGRQVLTWGTGDLVFINDLFPKDYISFFSGRDAEYLKRPSDAVRFLYWGSSFNADLVITPVMEANESLRGRRLSFYDGLKHSIEGERINRSFERPARTPENGEVALRVYRTFKSTEAALYYYRGFYKQPRGIRDASREIFFYPRLSVYGASVRGPVGGGIGYVEFAYYDSRQDDDGSIGAIENSSVKYLLGYSRDLGGDFKVGVQYYLEQMLDYGNYKAALNAGDPVADKLRSVFTVRLTRLYMAQTLRAGLFVFYSPSDEDTYLRPTLAYALSDALGITIGANIFAGKNDHTEFGQLEDNDSVYARVRYSF
jgi:hypothetical protein